MQRFEIYGLLLWSLLKRITHSTEARLLITVSSSLCTLLIVRAGIATVAPLWVGLVDHSTLQTCRALSIISTAVVDTLPWIASVSV